MNQRQLETAPIADSSTVTAHKTCILNDCDAGESTSPVTTNVSNSLPRSTAAGIESANTAPAITFLHTIVSHGARKALLSNDRRPTSAVSLISRPAGAAGHLINAIAPRVISIGSSTAAFTANMRGRLIGAVSNSGSVRLVYS